MKLASLKEGGRDGTLIVVNRDMSRAVKVPADRTDPAGRTGELGGNWNRP